MKSTTYLYIFASVIVLALIGYAVARPSAPSHLDGFAQCIKESGAKVYTAWWCPHCADQKKLFGDAFEKLNNVECAAGLPAGKLGTACTSIGVTSIPVWEMADGTRVPGTQTLKRLAELTKCALPPASQI